MPIHLRELELIVEVRHTPQSLPHHVGADRAGEVDQEPVERRDLGPTPRAAFDEHRLALLDGEERLFGRVGDHPDDDAVENGHAARNDVDMPEGGGIEAAGYECRGHRYSFTSPVTSASPSRRLSTIV